MKYAFFDLDGTLIPVDSSILWAETLLSHVGKDEKQLRAERIQYDVDYKNGCLDINKFEDFEMKLLARFPRRELDELRVQYLKRDIMPHVLPIAVDLVKKYRETKSPTESLQGAGSVKTLQRKRSLTPSVLYRSAAVQRRI